MADYSDASQLVGVDLSLSLQTNGGVTNDAYGDRFIDIEGVTGTPYDDSLKGNTQNIVLKGGQGNDILDAVSRNAQGALIDSGIDKLYGQSGVDSINCREFAGGSDIIVYESISDSPTGTWDVVTMDTNDIFDLSALDANALSGGPQHFTWIGSASFTGAGQLRVRHELNGVYVEGSTDGDTAPEFQIFVVNGDLDQHNFIL